MCWEESYHLYILNVESEKMCHKQILIYSCTSIHPESYCTGHLKPALALQPKGGHWALAIHSGHKTMLRLFLLSPQKENFHPCKKSVLPLAFLLSAILIPSCSWGFLPCVPEHSSVKLSLPIIISPSLEINASRQDLPKIVHPIRSKIKSNTKISSLLECHLLD